jgi:CDP-glucose 4,6-dehydratase
MVVAHKNEVPAAEFWLGKRVLVTGHTGFKGGWLAIWLHRMGAQVSGLSMAPLTSPNLFELALVDVVCDSYICDMRDQAEVARIVGKIAPDIVFHLAAQSLVRESYKSPIETFSTNVMGTAHLLEAIRDIDSVRAAVMITTDKVYKNNEWLWPYREGDALGGHDPYSASKAASEILISSYRSSFLAENGKALSSARAGNVIGGGDWSADRLIPDAVRAWQNGNDLDIRRPEAIRPWQHVLEPLAGYLKLAQASWNDPQLAGAYNFGPDTNGAASVRNVIELARATYGSGTVAFGDGNDGPHEAGLLTLEVTKSRTVLNVQSRWSLDESIKRTMQWYLAQSNGADARMLCESDIAAYEGLT